MLQASRIPSPFGAAKPRGSNPACTEGLRYERKVKKELLALVVAGLCKAVEHNSWFRYTFDFDPVTLSCSPDFILHLSPGQTLVIIEVKLTWVDAALDKVKNFYTPIVNAALASDRLSPLAGRGREQWAVSLRRAKPLSNSKSFLSSFAET